MSLEYSNVSIGARDNKDHGWVSGPMNRQIDKQRDRKSRKAEIKNERGRKEGKNGREQKGGRKEGSIRVSQ